MAIRSSEYFIFDGIPSNSFGIINVNISSGMQEEPFVAGREIRETSIRGNDRPYFQGIDRQPLQFNVSFAFEERWNRELINKVARWLTDHEYYKPLIFSDEPEKIYYALFVDNPTLIHNCLSEGYINLTVRCDSPYVYSPLSLTKIYDWNETPQTIEDSNMSQEELNNLIVDANGRLVLHPNKTKWSDLPSSTQ
mgnify:FL=1